MTLKKQIIEILDDNYMKPLGEGGLVKISNEIIKIFADTLLKAIGEPDGYGKTMQDAIEAKAKNSLRAELKTKIEKELGIKV